MEPNRKRRVAPQLALYDRAFVVVPFTILFGVPLLFALGGRSVATFFVMMVPAFVLAFLVAIPLFLVLERKQKRMVTEGLCTACGEATLVAPDAEFIYVYTCSACGARVTKRGDVKWPRDPSRARARRK